MKHTASTLIALFFKPERMEEFDPAQSNALGYRWHGRLSAKQATWFRGVATSDNRHTEVAGEFRQEGKSYHFEVVFFPRGGAIFRVVSDEEWKALHAPQQVPTMIDYIESLPEPLRDYAHGYMMFALNDEKYPCPELPWAFKDRRRAIEAEIDIYFV